MLLRRTDGRDRLAGRVTLNAAEDGATGFDADLSGDLAPLSHMTAVMIGHGEALVGATTAVDQAVLSELPAAPEATPAPAAARSASTFNPAISLILAAACCYSRVALLRQPLLLGAGLAVACGVLFFYVSRGIVI